MGIFYWFFVINTQTKSDDFEFQVDESPEGQDQDDPFTILDTTSEEEEADDPNDAKDKAVGKNEKIELYA